MVCIQLGFYLGFDVVGFPLVECHVQFFIFTWHFFLIFPNLVNFFLGWQVSVVGRQTGWAPCTVFYFNLEIEARGLLSFQLRAAKKRFQILLLTSEIPPLDTLDYNNRILCLSSCSADERDSRNGNSLSPANTLSKFGVYYNTIMEVLSYDRATHT